MVSPGRWRLWCGRAKRPKWRRKPPPVVPAVAIAGLCRKISACGKFAARKQCSLGAGRAGLPDGERTPKKLFSTTSRLLKNLPRRRGGVFLEPSGAHACDVRRVDVRKNRFAGMEEIPMDRSNQVPKGTCSLLQSPLNGFITRELGFPNAIEQLVTVGSPMRGTWLAFRALGWDAASRALGFSISPVLPEC